MTALAIDTLEFARSLKASGMPQEQAEATVKMVASIVENNLATKQDIINAKNELNLSLAENNARVESKINDLIKWILGFLVGQAAIIISCMKFIHS